MEAPEIPHLIVTWLEETFRDSIPDAAIPEHEKCALAGEQRVVRHVRQQYDRQQRGEDTDET